MKTREVIRNSRACLAAFVCCFIPFSGCAPYPIRYVSAPGVTGCAVDADTGYPIEGARVMVNPDRYLTSCSHAVTSVAPGGPPRARDSTLPDGHFQVPIQHRYYWADALRRTKTVLAPADATLIVEHANYQPFTTNIRAGDFLVYDLGRVGLTRTNR
jgi:hypothetical protein